MLSDLSAARWGQSTRRPKWSRTWANGSRRERMARRTLWKTSAAISRMTIHAEVAHRLFKPGWDPLPQLSTNNPARQGRQATLIQLRSVRAPRASHCRHHLSLDQETTSSLVRGDLLDNHRSWPNHRRAAEAETEGKLQNGISDE